MMNMIEVLRVLGGAAQWCEQSDCPRLAGRVREVIAYLEAQAAAEEQPPLTPAGVQLAGILTAVGEEVVGAVNARLAQAAAPAPAGTGGAWTQECDEAHGLAVGIRQMLPDIPAGPLRDAMAQAAALADDIAYRRVYGDDVPATPAPAGTEGDLAARVDDVLESRMHCHGCEVILRDIRATVLSPQAEEDRAVGAAVRSALEAQTDGDLWDAARDLKQTDGPGWAIGEAIEKVANLRYWRRPENQRQPAPEPSFEQQLAALGAKLLVSPARMYVVGAENRVSETFLHGEEEAVLRFATANRATVPEPTAPTVPPALSADEIKEALRQCAAEVRGSSAGRLHWEAHNGNIAITPLDPSPGEVEYALARMREGDNRPTLDKWAAANGGEVEAVRAECEKRGWRMMCNYTCMQRVVSGPGVRGAGPTWFAALAAACAAANVPTPWGPGKPAAPEAEWQPPETVDECREWLATRGFPLGSGWEDSPTMCQDACRWVHAREEAANAVR